MLLIPCPYCGEARPEVEFTYHGEAHIVRPENPSTMSDDEFAAFLFMRKNPKGVHAERWRHTYGCGCFFNVIRDTVTDEILATYRVGEPRPALAEEAGR